MKIALAAMYVIMVFVKLKTIKLVYNTTIKPENVYSGQGSTITQKMQPTTKLAQKPHAFVISVNKLPNVLLTLTLGIV